MEGPVGKSSKKMPMRRALRGKRNFLRRRQKRTRGSTTRSTSAVRWFLEEDDGEAESAKSEMMVASSVLCDLTPHCFVICDRRDRGVDSVLYTVLHATKHGRKRRDVAFFYSFNQSIRELRFHPFGFGNTVHNGSHDAKSYFHIWLHIVDAVNRTTWF